MSTAAVDEKGGPRVVLLVRAQCPTCVRMADVVAQVCAGTGDRWTALDVDDPATDPELRAEFADVVPVTLVDGREVASWSLAPDDLRRALGSPRSAS